MNAPGVPKEIAVQFTQLKKRLLLSPIKFIQVRLKRNSDHCNLWQGRNWEKLHPSKFVLHDGSAG